MDYTYLFPYEKIPKGSRILIYGAGDVGQAYLRQMKMTHYAEVVGMVDRAWERYPRMIVPLYAPDKITELSYDFIVLAFKMQNFADDVRATLEREGIPSERIVYQGARSDVGSMLAPQERVQGAGGRPVRFAYEEAPVSIALKYGPGLGDAIIKKKLFEAIAALAPMAKIDIYAPNASKFIPSIYRDEPCFHAAIDDGGAVYLDNQEKYGLSMSIFFLVLTDQVKYDVLKSACPALAEAAQKIADANARYKLTTYPTTQNWIHFGRARYRGWNCYNIYNYTGAFQIQGQDVTIPLDEAAEETFDKLQLGLYVTVNFGNGASSKGNQSIVSKQWPKEYFEAYIAGIHHLFPQLTVVQLGDKNALELAGADRRMLGQDFEVAKYILKHSLLHLDIEGGLMHLATQLGTKCIALYGSTQVEMFSYPQNINLVAEHCRGCYELYENTYACARGLEKPECMYSITPERVLAAAKAYLQKVLHGAVEGASRKGFFPPTNRALDRITELYHRVWGIAAGMWHLRQSAHAFVQEHPALPDSEFTEHFIARSGIHGANVRDEYLGRTWTEQQEFLAWWLLLSLFTIYDDWCNALEERYHVKFAFPGTAQDPSIRVYWNKNELPPSPCMEQTFYASYKAQKLYDWKHFFAMTQCYLFFKRMRNCYVHRGILANQSVVNAYQAYAGTYDSPLALGEKEAPQVYGVHKDQPISLSLRGVVGFSSILRKMIYTCDAEMICKSAAETCLLEECGEDPVPKVSVGREGDRTLYKIIRRAGFLLPKNANLKDIRRLFLDYKRVVRAGH